MFTGHGSISITPKGSILAQSSRRNFQRSKFQPRMSQISMKTVDSEVLLAKTPSVKPDVESKLKKIE